MRSVQKKPSSSGGPTRRLRALGGAHGAGDLQSRQIARIRKQVGNDTMKGSKDASTMRDVLLGLIGERLKVMRAVQRKELGEMKHVREWFREVARGETGFHAPDPTRWHEAARFFREAAEAMCRGNLARGAQLLERALGAERAAYESLPKQVRRKLEAEERQPSGYPAEMPHALDEAPLPPCALPETIDLAHQILSVEAQMDELPPIRARRRRRAWWEEEGEETEEEKAAREQAERGPGAEGARAEGPLEEEDEQTEQAEQAPKELTPPRPAEDQAPPAEEAPPAPERRRA